MLTIILAMNISMSIIFILMIHPLSMGSILLIQTVLISLLTGNMNSYFWFSYILFLIMVGGMLILFMYMTSIASNEKFKLNLSTIPITAFCLIATLLMPEKWNYIINNEMNNTQNLNNLNFSVNKFMNFPMMTIYLFLMIYLLLALIATVKITNFSQGSIRQMN